MCSAAQAAEGRRFLCATAPKLPLDQCDNPASCECRYERHQDRRAGPRRRAEGALPTGTQAASLDEQRSNQGRRADERGIGGEAMPWLR